ncbi:MAG TPA: NADPH-dependent FMN reductase, partial [Baekduia sp.]|nr:NADPH-dependent FMN reductase [Baekduia sp.]
MSTPINILTLVGSLRAESTNRKLAELAAEVAPDGVTVEIYDGLRDIPFYDEDIDGPDAPAAATALREALERSDALLFVSPLYNGGVPSHIKNGLDWLSRPQGNEHITGLPVAAIGTSWGEHGGSFGHEQLRKWGEIAGASPLDEVNLSIGGMRRLATDPPPPEDAGGGGDGRGDDPTLAAGPRGRGAGAAPA